MGFVPIPDWRSCFWHAKLSLFLTVYVDDFKLSGPVASVAKGWHFIRQHVKTENPQPTGKYLGCDHRPFEHTKDQANKLLHELLTLQPGSASSPATMRGGPCR